MNLEQCCVPFIQLLEPYGHQAVQKVPAVIPGGSACELASSAVNKIASSGRGEMQITAQRPVSTQSRECICEIGGKRGGDPFHVTAMIYCLLALKEPCYFAETSVKFAELGLGCFYF